MEVIHANTIKHSSAKAVGLGQSWQCRGMQHAAISLASPLHNSVIPGVWGEEQLLAEEPKRRLSPGAPMGLETHRNVGHYGHELL